jgi:hypothetical protein
MLILSIVRLILLRMAFDWDVSWPLRFIAGLGNARCGA